MPDIELHFQDDFTGQNVEVFKNGAQVAERPLSTRYQIGLAHIEKLNVMQGDTIEIRIPALGLSASAAINDPITNFSIVLRNGVLSISAAREPLRYM